MERQIRLFGNACETVRGQSVKYFLETRCGRIPQKPGELVRGDEVVITGPTTGALIVRADDIRCGEERVWKKPLKAMRLLPCRRKYRPADRLYRWLPTRTMKTLYVSDPTASLLGSDSRVSQRSAGTDYRTQRLRCPDNRGYGAHSHRGSVDGTCGNRSRL